MDISRALKTAISTGRVHFGVKQAKKAIQSGKAKMLIVASNCPEKFNGDNVVHFNGTNIDLGVACGKPFGISVITIEDEGESSILKIETGAK